MTKRVICRGKKRRNIYSAILLLPIHNTKNNLFMILFYYLCLYYTIQKSNKSFQPSFNNCIEFYCKA